jgi:hypothetical protein
MPGTIPILQEGARRLSNQLAIGNGAALLVIFNTVASNPELATDTLKGVAWLFAMGLAGAFFMVFSSFAYETADAALVGAEKVEPTNAKMLDAMLGRIGWAFLIAAGCFAIGLIGAISLIGSGGAAA